MSTVHTHTQPVVTQVGTEVGSAVVQPTIARRSRRGRSRITTLVLALAAALATLSLAAPADAYVNTGYAGRTGTVQFSPATGSAIVAWSNYRFATPSLFVYRNGAIDARYQQELQVTTSLQRWDGARWVQTDGFTQQVLLDMGTNGSVIVTGSVLQSQVRVAGYFRVVTAVGWGSASALPYWTGVFTGAQQFAPSNAVDMRCGIAACQNRVVSNGSLYVWG